MCTEHNFHWIPAIFWKCIVVVMHRVQHSRKADSQFPELVCRDVIKMVNTYKRLLSLS